MVRRFIRDESGIAMGLTVMIVLLIGVMAAGLLAFVACDILSVIEENKGQKALNITATGAHAAMDHLSTQNSTPQNVELTQTNDVLAGKRLSNAVLLQGTSV